MPAVRREVGRNSVAGCGELLRARTARARRGGVWVSGRTVQYAIGTARSVSQGAVRVV